MIAEYANIVLMCAMLSVMFFGGWNPGFPMDFAAHWNPTALSFFGFHGVLLEATVLLLSCSPW